MKNNYYGYYALVIFVVTLAMLVGAVFGFWIGENSQADAKLSDEAEELIEEGICLLKDGGLMIVEHTKPLEHQNSKFFISTKKYGSNFVSFIKHNENG